MKLTKLSDLFYIEICQNPISKDYALENPGETPYVTTTSENNGVECFVNYPPQYDGGVITVSKDGGNGDAFLQYIPFCGNEKVMVLTPKQKFTKQELFFYITAIKHTKYIFGYGRKCSVSRLSELYVPAISEIPAYVNKTPIIPIMTAVNTLGKALPDITQWQDYKFGNIINEMYRAESHIKTDYEFQNLPFENSIAFISRTESNNGCDCYVPRSGLSGIEEGNAIVIGDTTATCSYQLNEFVCGDHMVVCRADWINVHTALFVISLLNAEKYRYSYGRAFKMQLIEETMIKLPSNKDGDPDWKMIEDYIKLMPYGDRI